MDNKQTNVSVDKFVEDFNYNIELTKFKMNQSMNGMQHYHHHHEILYIVEGKRILYLNDDTYVMDDTYIALLPPYVFHGSGCGTTPIQARYMIAFKNYFIPQKGKLCDINLFSCFNLKYPVIKLDENQKTEVKNLMERMTQLYQTKENDYDKLSFSFYLCNLLLLCMKIQSQKTQFTTDNSNMTGIIKYIEENYYEDITLDLLSEKFFINKYKLSRQFKDHLGINMLKYLNKLRISKSKKMLAETDQKITNIAGEIGFNNTTHFNRVFKDEIGCSPTDYRIKSREFYCKNN